MRNLKRTFFLTITLAVAFAAVRLPAQDKVDTSKPVKLKMYFVYDQPPDADLVFEQMNKIMKQKINATIDVQFIPSAGFRTAYPLLFSSGEAFDMIYTAGWLGYSETAGRGGFKELDMETLKRTMPLTMASLPAEAWQNVAINGKIYMVPQNNPFALHHGMVVRGDLRQKYKLPELKTLDDLEAYFEEVKRNEPGMIPYDAYNGITNGLFYMATCYPEQQYMLTGGLSVGTLAYNYSDPKVFDVKPITDTPAFRSYINRMRSWNEKGYLSKSDLTTTALGRFDIGKSAAKPGNLGNAQTAWLAKPDWKVEFFHMLAGKKLAAQGFTGNGTAISATTRNLERALMATDLLGYDPELNFLIVNGIPGVHANLMKNETYYGRKAEYVDRLAASTRFTGFTNWNFTNTVSLPKVSFPGYVETLTSFYFKQVAQHPLNGFIFDSTSVKTELANVTPIMNQYLPMLHLGFAENPEATLQEMLSKAKSAGLDKINAEIMAQAKRKFDAAR